MTRPDTAQSPDPTPAAAPVAFDPYDYAIDADPYPTYRALRDHAPLYYSAEHDFYALTRFDDVLEAFLDFETYSSARGTVLELMDDPTPVPLIIFMDPPRQTRMRNLVSKAFTPRRIATLGPAIREIARGYLDPLVGRDRFDVVRDFTAKLPMDVISTLLGIPPADRDAVRGWSNDILHRDPGNPLPTERGFAAMGHLMRYFSDSLAERRRRPRDDMMTELIGTEIRDDAGERHRLTDVEIKSFFNLLATAGNETVTKLLATAFYWLSENPDERRRLIADPGLLAGCVEETLRYDPPSHYQGRVTTRAVERHGVAMPEGAKVLLINGATGRDERRFADPDRYDVRREIDQHLGFGYGRHVCLGAFLARLESRVAIGELLARFPDYAVAESGVERMHSSNVRGMSGLVVEV